jgi:hypothetical protein
MSGWDASRPTRDPHRHESGTGPRQAGGAPPDIFEREYGAQAYPQQPYGQPDGRADYSQPDYSQPDYGQPEYGQPEYGQPGYGQPEYGQPDYGSQEFPPRHRAEHAGDDRNANGHGRPGPAQDGYPGQDYSPWEPDQQDFGQQNFGQQDYGRPGRPPGFGQLDREQPDYGQQERQLPGFGPLDREQPDYGQPDHRQPDHGQPDHRGSGYAGRDNAGRDTLGRDTADSAYAARMDPALQDFFKPVPPAPGFTPSGPQPRLPGQPGQSRQPGQPDQQRNGEPFPPTQPHRPFRPEPGHGAPTTAAPWAAQEGGPGRTNGTDGWGDTDAPRPGSRSARRQDRQPPRRGRAIAGVAIGVVVVVGLAAAAYKLLDKKNTSTPAASSTTPAVSPAQHQPTPGASHQTTSTGSQSAGYTLSAPASAGGYSKLATAPGSVVSVATATSQSARQQAVNAGGKVTGQVTGYYQLSSGQVMSFSGYEGTFDPAKVLAGVGGKAYPAGPHGGDLVCAPSAGTPGGTVCEWATTTTLGVTEFFGSTGNPEVVTDQAKAAEDTVNVRADVEAAKS